MTTPYLHVANLATATVLLGLAVLIFIVPIIMGMEGARNMLVRIRKPQHLLWVPKWANLGWILLVGPLLILVLIFGVLVVGSTPHFRTGHGVGLPPYSAHLYLRRSVNHCMNRLSV